MPRAILFLLLLHLTPMSPLHFQAPSPGKTTMKILVHITHGPESPTRSALGFHVAKAAVDEGHSVTVFLAGDAVQLMRDGTLDQLTGLGTGKLRELHDALVAAGVPFYLSAGSSQARGLTEGELRGKKVHWGAPRDLVRLATEHDRLFSY